MRRHHDLAEAEVSSDMLELLAGGEYSMEAAREAVDHLTQSGDEMIDASGSGTSSTT
jgi:hypothetical protein